MCGVVGLIGSTDAAKEAFLALTTLQHRGQDAAGILTYDQSGFHGVKNIGLVESVFTRANMEQLTGSLAVGHARYSTIGRGDLTDVQPFLLSYPHGLGMVHNGNIVNCGELALDLKRRARRNLLTQSDTEVVLNILAEGLARGLPGEHVEYDDTHRQLSFDHLCSAVENIFRRVNGSYSIVTLIADQGLVAFRDPQGLRPLIWGRRKNEDGTEAHILASESVALSFLGYEVVRDIQPGEIIYIDMQGSVHTRVFQRAKGRSSHCMFEWVYFASPESIIDRIPVYGTRIELGRNLAQLVKERMRELNIQADVVVPVPETSRIAAIALAEELGIPYREVLIKNRYIKRTFILDSQEKRQKAVNLKLSPVRSEILGKKVLLVDDSIVRGTTSKKIIELVRNAGAEKVYFVSTCPPIQHPCFYGIDFPEGSELIANGRSLQEIEKELEADAVIYQDIPGLEQAIQNAGRASPDHRPSPCNPFAGPNDDPVSSVSPCMACLNGKYPTDVRVGLRFALDRMNDRNGRRLGSTENLA